MENLPQQVPGISPKRLHKGSSVQWLLGFSRQAPACLEKGWGSAVRGDDCPALRITPTALALHSLWEQSVQPPHSQCTTGGCCFAESAQMAKGLSTGPPHLPPQVNREWRTQAGRRDAGQLSQTAWSRVTVNEPGSLAKTPPAHCASAMPHTGNSPAQNRK